MEIVCNDFTLWLYERYMGRKAKPLQHPVRQPGPGNPEEADFQAAFNEWLEEDRPEEPESESATSPATKPG